MLFSNAAIADFINQNFEPAWMSVRAVPIVRIDFGNGTLLTRTLHGNIATMVCDAEGNVLDVMPGIYDPQTYVARLNQFLLLERWLRQEQGDTEARFRSYHQIQFTTLQRGDTPQVIRIRPPAAGKGGALDRTKVVRIEGPLELVLQPAARGTSGARASGNPPAELQSEASRTLWQSLAEDTRVNESVRRQMVHGYLAEQGFVQPADLTKWLYRDVLHADLDDPYLGLGDTLFATYPFNDESGL